MRGYCEVVSPNIYNSDLFKISGHYQKYEKDMFWIQSQSGEEFGLKPMNCPGHCLMFRHTNRSHRDLPIRFADFGVLHRNEIRGALSGLTRVRRFQQDDAHIFCRVDQVEDEIVGALDFMKYVYDIFGMKYVLQRSTRPDKAVGADTEDGIARWDRAEEALAKALDRFAGEGEFFFFFTSLSLSLSSLLFSYLFQRYQPNTLLTFLKTCKISGTWKDNPKDGAFYGPKIDIKVMDCMDRLHQCATVQLDFQLPIRFDLQYRTGEVVVKDGKKKTNNKDNKETNKSSSTEKTKIFKNLPNSKPEPEAGFARPVMVHRAMLGSVERMMAILMEHFAGKWPMWCSPRQAVIIPLHKDFNDYAQELQDRFRKHGFFVDADVSKEKFRKKIREGVMKGYNYQLIVGKEEVEAETVAVRMRGSNDDQLRLSVDDMIKRMQKEVTSHEKSPELVQRLKEQEEGS
jgi:threonyl-tRNA synthetase